MRTHYCGEVSGEIASQSISLCGWVDRRRDLGGLIFLGMAFSTGIEVVILGQIFVASFNGVFAINRVSTCTTFGENTDSKENLVVFLWLS